LAKFTFKETNLEMARLQYTGETQHRFMVYSYAFLILLIYEVLMGFSRTPLATAYEGVDLWFKLFNSVFQYGTRFISLLIMGYLGYWLVMDWTGWKTPRERREEMKMLRVMKDFLPRPKPSYRPNWYYFGFQAVEGFAYGTAIYLLLQVVVWLALLMPFSELPIPKPLDASPTMIHYMTNPIQDLALAFGAGFYEEVLFRWLLLWGLLVLAGRFPRFQALQTDAMPVGHLPGMIPAYNLKDKGFRAAISVGAVLYALSHYVYYFGDTFSLYSFFYRFFFGLLMYYIFARRHIGIAMWTHTVHDVWYFLLR